MDPISGFISTVYSLALDAKKIVKSVAKKLEPQVAKTRAYACNKFSICEEFDVEGLKTDLEALEAHYESIRKEVVSPKLKLDLKIDQEAIDRMLKYNKKEINIDLKQLDDLVREHIDNLPKKGIYLQRNY